MCLVQDCGPPPDIEGGDVVYSDTVYLSEAMYTCESGFRVQPPASSVRVCEEGGMWEESGTCERELRILNNYCVLIHYIQ